MAVSAVANYFVSRHLLNVAIKTDSVALDALEADALHLRTDVYTSVGVLGGLAAIKFTGRARPLSQPGKTTNSNYAPSSAVERDSPESLTGWIVNNIARNNWCK